MYVIYTEKEIMRCLRLGGHQVPLLGSIMRVDDRGVHFRFTPDERGLVHIPHGPSDPEPGVHLTNGIEEFYNEELEHPHSESSRNSEHMQQLYGEIPDQDPDFSTTFVDGEDFCDE